MDPINQIVLQCRSSGAEFKINRITTYDTFADLFSDGLLSFATISLALKVPRITDSKTQQVAVIVWSGVIFVMYSFLLSVFRMKNGGYPFWLPPFF